jgi:hypothetical protein
MNKLKKKESIDELTNELVGKLTKQRFQTVSMPSKLPDSRFVYASKPGDDKSRMVTFVTVLDTNKYAKQIVKEMEAHKRSVRIYNSNPAGSSVRGIPLSVWIQDLQAIAESIVDKSGDSSNAFGVVTKNGFRMVKTKNRPGEKPFDAVARVGREHHAELVILIWGGFERAVEEPYDRNGRESVSVTAFRSDGTVFAGTRRTYERNGKNIIWAKKPTIEWAGGPLRFSVNPKFQTAWKKAA